MRLKEFIPEARRNPELNPRQYTIDIFEQLYKQVKDSSDYIYQDTPNLFANFLGLEKIGINPKPEYSTTPVGVYGYPIKYIIEWVNSGKTLEELYAGSEPFVNIFQVRKEMNIINLNIISAKECQRFIEKMILLMAKESDQSPQQMKKYIKQHTNYVDNEYNDVKEWWTLVQNLATISSQIWKADYVFRFTRLLRKIGIDAVYDPGNGIVHPHEPDQLVVFHPHVIKNNQRILNVSKTKSYSYIYLDKLKDTSKMILLKKNPEIFFNISHPSKIITDLAIELGVDKKQALLAHYNETEESLENNIEKYNKQVNLYKKSIRLKDATIIELEKNLTSDKNVLLNKLKNQKQQLIDDLEKTEKLLIGYLKIKQEIEN